MLMQCATGPDTSKYPIGSLFTPLLSVSRMRQIFGGIRGKMLLMTGLPLLLALGFATSVSGPNTVVGKANGNCRAR